MFTKKFRKPIAIVLVIALVISMSVFILGVTPNSGTQIHEGFASASIISALGTYTPEIEREPELESPNVSEPEPPAKPETPSEDLNGDDDVKVDEEADTDSEIQNGDDGYEAEDSYTSEDAYTAEEDIYTPENVYIVEEDVYAPENVYTAEEDIYTSENVYTAEEDVYTPANVYSAEEDVYTPEKVYTAEEDVYTPVEEVYAPANAYTAEVVYAPVEEVYTPANTYTADNISVYVELSESEVPTTYYDLLYDDHDDEDYDFYNLRGSWDLRDFVTGITVTDLNGNPIEQIDIPETDDYDIPDIFNQLYRFSIEFAEIPGGVQLEYNTETNKLHYELPYGLQIQTPMVNVPIRTESGAVVGWYTLGTNGLIQVWFDHVTVDGEQTPDGRNFIEYYDDVKIILTIDALLLEDSYGFLDFGNSFVFAFPQHPSVTPMYPLSIEPASTVVFSSELARFFDNVVITDSSGAILAPGATPFIGETYRFSINFSEKAELQMEYNLNGVLTYSLPVPPLIITHDTEPNQPIRIANGNIVGWYSIDTAGNVTVRFDNVNQNGEPSDSNFIDLTNVTLTLDIYAQFNHWGGGNIDFGDGIYINFPETVFPPSGINVHKQSRYDPNGEIIHYMIRISATGHPSGATVNGLTVEDTPTINGSRILNPSASNAFSGFTYEVVRVHDNNGFIGSEGQASLSVVWAYDPPGGYARFASIGLLTLDLHPGDYIIIRYNLSIQQLIANNPTLVPNALNYSFNVGNAVTVGADGGDGRINDNDSVNDPVRKQFAISKDGVVIRDGVDYFINWHVEVGDGVSPALNGGTIIETLGAGLMLPDPSGIEFTFHIGSGTGSVQAVLTAAQLINVSSGASGVMLYTEYGGRTEFRLIVPTNLTIGAAVFGSVYKVEINFRTSLGIAPPHPGMPPINFENTVSYIPPGGEGDGPFTGGAVVPIRPPATGILSKTTSGICGTPTLGYYVDYAISLRIPAGLLGEPLWIFDTLNFYGNGSSVPNVPQNLLVSAVWRDAEHGIDVPVFPPLIHTAPIPHQSNGWKIFFGTTIDPALGGMPSWQFNREVYLTITYRIVLDINTVSLLQSNSGGRLQNSTYFINNLSSTPVTSSALASVSTNDYWPIHKKVVPTDNPGLFNYIVTINGGYSSRNDPLFRPGSSPSFTDIFDVNLSYVPESFYIRNTTTGQIFAPPGDLTIFPVTPNRFVVNLRDLHQFNAPPHQGGTSINASPGEWFADKATFEVRYSLLHPHTDDAIPQMRNTASINVNAAEPGHCVFESTAVVNYVPRPLDKTMNLTGTDLINVQIIVNADGGTDFKPNPGATDPGPNQITAKDELTNLQLYTDTIRLFTQNLDGGIWDGIWVQVPHTFNTGDLWSVNIESATVVNFEIPNRRPVRITYDALVTFPDGATSGEVQNNISIFGEIDGDGREGYEVGGSEAGAGGSRQNVMLFKRDAVNDLNIRGATFDLLGVNLANGNPVGGAPVDTIARGITGMNFGNMLSVVTDHNGSATLSSPWLVATYDFLFLLSETSVPDWHYDVAPPNSFTFFTINPRISQQRLDELQAQLSDAISYNLGGADVSITINRISDFITITNVPLPGEPYSLRIIKDFPGLTDEQILTYLQNFQLIVTDPLGVRHVFGINDVLAGIVMKDIPSGFFFFEELNYNVPGYVMTARPTMPFRQYIDTRGDREVRIVINNIYESLPKITINKTFHPPQLESLVSMISFLITGTDDNGNEIYRNTVFFPSDFTNGSISISNLPPGNYVITEKGGYAEGYLSVGKMPIVFRLRLGDDLVLDVRNTYMREPAPETPSLRIRKVFHGLTANQYPANFRIQLTWPDGSVTYHTLDASNQVLLEDLPPGLYFVNEVGYNVPGFSVVKNPPLPIRVYVLPLYEHGDNPVIQLEVIDNIYTRIPYQPPGPGGPWPPIQLTPPDIPPQPPEPEDPNGPDEPDDPDYPNGTEDPDGTQDSSGTDDPDATQDPNESAPPGLSQGGGSGSPQTGDDSNSLLYMALMFVGMIAVGIGTSKLKGRKNR